MRVLMAALPLLAAAGCADTPPRPYAPVGDVHYSALGQDPFWMLTIGEDRIVLRTAGEGPNEAVWPRTLPRNVDGITTWQSGDGTQVISIESGPGPCRDTSGREYQDHVRVRLSGSELIGCGGRLLQPNG